MPYDNVVSRTDAAALIPEDVVETIIGAMPEQSAAMALFRQMRASRLQTRVPALSAFPVAYFVNGDTGLKQTTELAWENTYINIEEIACILAVPDSVADDVESDIWDAAMPYMEEAIGRTFDAAVFFGTNKPASWPTAIVTAAAAAGNTVNAGANAAAAGGRAQDFSDLFATVEADGFDVNGVIANRLYRGRLRSVRSTTGEPMVDQVSAGNIYGVSPNYPMRGMWPAVASGVASAIAGDFTQGIVAVRQDITWKKLDQAVIQDGAGAIIFNLAQQDMQALRVVFRVGFAVPNPVNRDQAVLASRYPFAVMLEP